LEEKNYREQKKNEGLQRIKDEIQEQRIKSQIKKRNKERQAKIQE
jgi:hypothetical protein